ncbi:MAG: ATP-binding protein [Proteocatella sp.]
MDYASLIFISFLQSVIGFALMSSALMRFKEPVKKRIVMGLSVMTLGIIYLWYILFTKGTDSVDHFAIIVILIIQLVWFLICADDNFFVSLFSFLTFVNIYISINYIGDTLAFSQSGSSFVIELIIIRTIIYIIIVPLLFKFIRPKFRDLVDALDKEWIIAGLMPLTFLLWQIILLYYPEPYWRGNRTIWDQYSIGVAYILFLVVYYQVYIQANTIVEKHALEKRQILMMQQEKLWESELARQKATSDLIYQQRHDMRHHNIVIMGMLQSGKFEELKSYMKDFDAALEVTKTNVFCSNPIVNSILNLYVRKAETEHINMTVNAIIPENIGIDNIDLTCVLGNALENALEGCLRMSKYEEKYINFTSKFVDNRLRVQVENTCRNDVVFENDMPITQKQGGGTGTKSILYTIERYDGMVGFSIKDGKFVTQIVLNAR